MISPVDLVKRAGVGGRLVPFFKCVCLYFIAGCGASPSLAVAAAKCAPVLCLLLPLALQHGAGMLRDEGRYPRRVALGLALSALGDTLLVWPEQLVAGMAAFALAHVAYIGAFQLRGDALALAALCYGASAYYLTLLRPPGPLLLLVPLYSALLATMAWRAAARLTKPGAGWHAAAGAAGALMFLVSDSILGYSLFGGPVPHMEVQVMSTYYLGQLGIALSALEPLREHRY